ncbi:hypothetical protein ACN38_g5895 [Penicillium nordicum]|uniref:Uncharacterized protein n=1 Tax=Penicillium nordicum TaxID=229535 RepID=A0A0M9WFS1_9EURO|nr:hypothetical protein ACN38_g5895 [Penicillium nordicum]
MQFILDLLLLDVSRHKCLVIEILRSCNMEKQHCGIRNGRDGHREEKERRRERERERERVSTKWICHLWGYMPQAPRHSTVGSS